MRTLSILMLALALPCALPAQTVYKCTNANGVVEFADKPCADDPAKVETVDTSRAQLTGSGGSLAEQAEFTRMNEIKRNCDTRAAAMADRYRQQYTRISRSIADLEKRIAGTPYRLRGSAQQGEWRTEITALAKEREELRRSEPLERSTLESQCEQEVLAEETAQAAAREERAKAQREVERLAAEKAYEEKKRAEVKAQVYKDAGIDPQHDLP